jgi:ABC-2 type transport system ATP-binding protein
VDRVVEKTGLMTVRKRLIHKISRGYRQRTGVAMALLGNPPVLLLDEPTSGLDPNQVIEIRELIRDLSGERTVLLSSHILSEVAQICSEVLIINQGKLVASGTPLELSERFGPGQGLHVRVAGTLDPSVLESVPGVRGVTRGSAAGDWRIAVDHGDTVAPLVSRVILDQGGELLELRQEASDLEEVFRAVTREGDGDA